MHELSIAASIVDAVTESVAAQPDLPAGSRVKEVRLRVGVLSAVIEDSLQFCWELAAEGTLLQGSDLVIQMLPVVVHCSRCNLDSELEGVNSFRCPRCGELAGEIRQGRELEIESIEIEEPEASRPAGVEERT